MKNSMMLVTSSWGNDKTFKLLPISSECPYNECRKMLETFYEYYVEHLEEIEEFVKLFAVNADKYDYKQYLTKPVETAKPSSLLTGI